MKRVEVERTAFIETTFQNGDMLLTKTYSDNKAKYLENANLITIRLNCDKRKFLIKIYKK